MEFVKKPLELRIYGTEVKLNKPTYGMAKEWDKKIRKAGDKSLEVIGDCLVSCGLPTEMLDTLEMDHLLTIQELLLPGKKN